MSNTLDKALEIVEIMDKLQYRLKVSRSADNMKMATIGILMLSLLAFTHIGSEATENIIWYWVTGMVSLLAINLFLDYRVSVKMKQFKENN